MTIAGPVLVTGGTGFIGRRLIDRLLEIGVDVRSFALPDEPIPERWGDRVRILRGDITQADEVAAAVSGAATVFHLAAVVGFGAYDLHWAVTVEGSRNVFDGALDAGAKLVLASSIVVYGDQIRTVECHEGLEYGNHQGAYSHAKMAQEKLALEYHRERDLPLVVVRPANVYGVGSGPWVEGMLGLLRVDRLPIIGDGSGNAGLVHVDNLVEAFLLAGANESAIGRIYTVCDGLDVTWSRYFNDLAAMLQKGPLPCVPLQPLEDAALELEDPQKLIAMDGMSTFPLELLNLIGHSNRFDTRRIREELGWRPTVSYQQALEEIRRSLPEGG